MLGWGGGCSPAVNMFCVKTQLNPATSDQPAGLLQIRLVSTDGPLGRSSLGLVM